MDWLECPSMKWTMDIAGSSSPTCVFDMNKINAGPFTCIPLCRHGRHLRGGLHHRQRGVGRAPRARVLPGDGAGVPVEALGAHRVELAGRAHGGGGGGGGEEEEEEEEERPGRNFYSCREKRILPLL